MSRKKGRCSNKSCQRYNKERPIRREGENCDYCGKNSIEITGEIEEPKGYVLPERLQKIKNNLPHFKIKNEEREVLSIFLQYDRGTGLGKQMIYKYYKYHLKYCGQKISFNVYETLEEMAKKGIIIYEYGCLRDISENIFNFLYETIPDAFEKLITDFYYLAPVDNIPSIIENGIMCRNEIRKSPFRDVSNPEIQDARGVISVGGLTLHDYVNVFFAKRPPMFHSIVYRQKIPQQEIGYVCIDRDVLLSDGVYFSDGNARTKKTEFYCDLKDLENIS